MYYNVMLLLTLLHYLQRSAYHTEQDLLQKEEREGESKNKTAYYYDVLKDIRFDI